MIIPGGWKQLKIGDCSSVKRGASPRPIQDPKWWGGEVGWVRISDVTASSKYLIRTRDYLSKKGVRHSVEIKTGEVILSICATIGRAIITTEPVCIHDGFVWFDELDEGIEREYFYYYLSSKESELASSRQTGTQGNLNTDIVSKVDLIFPKSKPEQTKIAEVLSTVDQAIELTKAVIAKQQRIKNGLTQDILTRGIDENGNLRSEKTHKFKDSLLGRIPEEWDIEPFGYACERVSVGIATSTTKYYREDGVPLLRNQNILHGKFDLRDLLYISAEFDLINKSKRLKPGDLIMMRTGYPGRTAVAPDFIQGWQTFTTLISTPKKSRYLSDFLCLQINSSIGRGQILTLQGGGAQQNLNVGWVINMKVLKPSIEEQKRMIAVLTETEKSLTANVSLLNKFCLLKTALMQDLLTGKKRVTPLLNDTEVMNG